MDIDLYFDQVEAYINGTLTPAERAAFEVQIKENPELKKLVLQHVLANESLGLAIEDEIGSKLDRLKNRRNEREELTPPSIKIPFWQRPIVIAATITILLAVGLTFILSNSYSNESLADSYYEAYTLPGNRNEVESSDTYRSGLVALSNNEKQTAIKEFSAITADSPEYFDAQYLVAHLWLEEGNYEVAEQSFENLLNTPELPFGIDRNQLEWNRILSKSLKKSADKSEVMNELDLIAKDVDNPNAEKAKALRGNLSSFWRGLFN